MSFVDRRSPLATLLLCVLLVGTSLALWGCGGQPAADVDTSPTVTFWDTGVSTTSTTAATVPASPGGITRGQVVELLARQSGVPVEDWEVRDCTNLGDWAIANVYTSRLSAWMDEDSGVAAVFREQDGAWFQAGWVSVADPPDQRAIELTNMGAPAEVWRHFGLDPASLPTGRAYPPEQMPADFGFIAAYGVWAKNVIDTRTGIFAKDLGPNEEEPVTTELTLPPEALESLYQDLVAMQNTWQMFTAEFVPDPDPGDTGTSLYVSPHLTYRLEWQAAGFSSRSIVWEDSALSTDPRAVALRQWFEKLQQMIEASPEWKALPPMEGGYA